MADRQGATFNPYTGVPDVSPRDIPTSSVNINTPPAAFGVNVAEAIGHLGQVEEGAGKEMFDRAYAMQQLKVHADVNSRLTDAQNKMMDVSAGFNSKEGANAVDGLNDFKSNLDAARASGGRGLSPYGQELYDTESRSWQFRIGFSGTQHAAEELKRYSQGAAKSQVMAADDMVGLDPKNDSTWTAAIKQKTDALNHLADLGGLSPDQRKEMLTQGVSESILKRAHAVAENSPTDAKDMLNKAIANKQVVGDQVEKEAAFINQRELQISSRNIAAGTMSGAHLEFGNAIVPSEQAQSGIKAIEGGNYSASGPTTRTGDHAIGAYQVMGANLGPWLREAGMPAMTEAQFKADHDAQDALFNFKFGQYMQQDGNFNRAAAHWFTGNPDSPMDHSDGYHTLAQYLQVANAGLAGRVPLARAVAVGRQQAANLDPLNTELQDETQRRIESQYASNARIAADTEKQNAETLYGSIYNGIGPDKKLPTTVEELSADPDSKQAWDYISLNDPKKLGGFLSALSKNARGDVALTPERLDSWAKLSGQAVNDPVGFMEATKDLSKVDLPKAQLLQIIKLRDSIYKKQDAAPQMSHALALLSQQGMLRAAGLTKDQDPDNLNLFSGILHDAMTQYNSANGKQMSDQDILTTAQRLLNQAPKPHWWSSTPKPWFESIDTVPPEAATAISKEFQARGVMPSESAILQSYLSAQYQNLWGKAAHVPTYGPRHSGGSPTNPIIPEGQ